MKTKSVLFVVVLISVVSSVFCAAADEFELKPAPLKGRKIAIFLDHHYQIDEAFYTPLRLREAGADVKVVSHYSPCVRRDAHTVKADMTPEEALKITWDGVVVIGGFSPLEIREDRNLIGIIKDVNNRGGMVSAICHGVCALVTADIIRGKTVTGNIPRRIEFTNAGANFVEKAPCVDGNIITAIGPADNGPYLDAMIHWFGGGEKAAKARQDEKYLKGKKVAIVIDNRYNYDQLKYPFVRLRHNGAEVYFIAKAEGEYKEYGGIGSTKADMTARDACKERFDAVILLSHWAADTFRRSADVREFVAMNLKAGTLVASINWGHTVLISADVCKEYEIATTWGMQNDIKNAGGTAMLKPVHRDRSLITCAADDDMPELMRYVAGYLRSIK